ncbi:MAG: serine/threonine protein kinase [Streptosporangiaceae bacterium]
MSTATVGCAQPGCGGTIQDGYCNTCGMAPAPAVAGPPAPAVAGPVPAPAASTSSGSQPTASSSGTSGTGGRTTRSRHGTSRAARGRLGAGLLEIPRVPYRDPASAVLSDPQVPENKRFCGHCDQPVGRGRDGRPGL